MNKLITFLCLLVGFSGFVLFSGCSDSRFEKDIPKAQRGVLDLRKWDFQQDGTVLLSGEWQFFWQKYIEPDVDFDPNAQHVSNLIKVPGTWNGHKQNGEKISGDGFGSYRLQILKSPHKEHLALKLLDMATAYRIYVNGELLFSSGFPGKTTDTTIPRLFPSIVEFEAGSKKIDILVHVANFHHWQGGMWESIKLGHVSTITAQRNKNLYVIFFLLGSIFIMGLYHFGLYWNRKTERSTLFFGVFCILIAIRLLTTGERYILHFFPDLSYEWLEKCIYISFYLSIPVFTLYVKNLFPNEISSKVVWVAKLVGIIFSVVVLITSARFYTITMPGVQFIALLLFSYGTWAVGLSYKRNRDSAGIFLFGFVVLFTVAANDILYTRQFLNTGYFFPTGFFIFIFSQAYIISRRFSKAFSIVEDQKQKLQIFNVEYEKELEERKRSEKKLNDSEKQYRLLAENISDTIWVLNLETMTLVSCHTFNVG